MTSLASAIEELRSNEKQWQAFNAEGNCVVLAPPGSGKTKLLTVKLAAALERDIEPPRGAACVTFTRAAALQLETRIRELGTRRRPNLIVGTVHSFAMNQIIAPYAKLADRAAATNPLGKARDLKALYLAAENEFFERGERRTAVDFNVRLRRQHLNFDQRDQRLGGERTAKIAVRYGELLEEHRINDFESIVDHAVHIVEDNAWVREALSARFPQLFLDEYQDLAPGLDRLASALCFGPQATTVLFAVGDPDQSIMSFTGSRPELLDELAEREGIIAVRLAKSYRSGSTIGQAALRGLQADRSIEWQADGGEIEHRNCPNGWDHQVTTAVEIVSEAIAAATNPREVAALCPTNAMVAEMASALTEAGFPVVVPNADYPLTPATRLVEDLARWASRTGGNPSPGLGAALRTWRKFTRSSSDQVGSELVEFLLAVDATANAGDFVAAVGALGLRAGLERTGQTEELEALEALGDAVSTGSLAGISISELGLRAGEPEGIYVSTMHTSKGLEFNRVVILGLDEGTFPNYYAGKDDTQLAEARRAFYVSITRARHRVDLLSSGFVINQYNKRYDNGPSRFIADLDL